MIRYNQGWLGLAFVFQCSGSVFPKAFAMTVPSTLAVFFLHAYFRQDQNTENPWNFEGIAYLWTTYTSVLSFLVVFRNNQAYTRFWEGATLITHVRGEWFNAISTCFAFCNHSADFEEQVKLFQRTLVRLASMLYCSALQQVCEVTDDRFDIIECLGMDPESLTFMQESNDRCEVILQWMQRLIVDADEAKIIKIAPPLLTRVYQELSRGIVNLSSARKIKEIPFPFPYAQLITCMLIVHWVVTPVIASQVMISAVAATCAVFLVTFVLWCLVLITMEIDQPFGDDANDLPLHRMQKDFNRSLLTLMHPLAQSVPAYEQDDLRQTIAQHQTPGFTLRQSVQRLSMNGPEAENILNMMRRCTMNAASVGLTAPSRTKAPELTRSRAAELSKKIAPSWFRSKDDTVTTDPSDEGNLATIEEEPRSSRWSTGAFAQGAEGSEGSSSLADDPASLFLPTRKQNTNREAPQEPPASTRDKSPGAERRRGISFRTSVRSGGGGSRSPPAGGRQPRNSTGASTNSCVQPSAGSSRSASADSRGQSPTRSPTATSLSPKTFCDSKNALPVEIGRPGAMFGTSLAPSRPAYEAARALI